MLIEDMDRDRLVELCKRWERAHCGVGICGSEYYADPERVFAAVRATMDAQHKAILRAKGLVPREY